MRFIVATYRLSGAHSLAASLLATAVALAAGCLTAEDAPERAPRLAQSPTLPGPQLNPLDDASSTAPKIDPNAFFENDPPPSYCGPVGGNDTPPPLPGGTPECPEDKNREGCPCTKRGETAPCWPGLRADRNKGICTDGVTTCIADSEFSGHWGPCEGFVLPDPNATRGPSACNCFSKGTWQIDNLAPCLGCGGGCNDRDFERPRPNVTFNAKSARFDENGEVACDTGPAIGLWAKNRLTVDCEGQFRLCYTLKAGEIDNPLPTDCTLGKTCVDTWYEQAGVTQELPMLPAWQTTDSNCVRRFIEVGGYGEMSVIGTSKECEPIDDEGQPLVFHRVDYCPPRCNKNPNAADCSMCQHQQSGEF